MKNVNKKFTDCEIRVNCQVGYCHLFEARAMGDSGKPKYECTIIIDKEDKQAMQLVNDAIEAAKTLYAEQFGKPKGKLKTWVRDGDEEKPDDPTFANKIYFSAKSDRQPDLKMLENGMLVDALDGDDIYSGCFCGALLRFYPYKTPDNAAGISCGLNAIVKLEDGPKLAGGISSSAAFADLI